jgi:hypothetical protein
MPAIEDDDGNIVGFCRRRREGSVAAGLTGENCVAEASGRLDRSGGNRRRTEVNTGTLLKLSPPDVRTALGEKYVRETWNGTYRRKDVLRGDGQETFRFERGADPLHADRGAEEKPGPEPDDDGGSELHKPVAETHSGRERTLEGRKDTGVVLRSGLGVCGSQQWPRFRPHPKTLRTDDTRDRDRFCGEPDRRCSRAELL